MKIRATVGGATDSYKLDEEEKALYGKAIWKYRKDIKNGKSIGKASSRLEKAIIQVDNELSEDGLLYTLTEGIIEKLNKIYPELIEDADGNPRNFLTATEDEWIIEA